MPAAPPARRVDGSMSLLVDLMQHAEDPAYADAVARSRTPAAPVPLRRRRRVLGGALLVGLAGLLTGTAAAAVRASQDEGPSRAALVEEVQERTRASDDLAREAATLRAEVAARREEALDDGAQAQALVQLELAAATVAVTGPGLEVVLDDRPPEDAAAPGLPRGGQAGSGRVLDRDLQEVVNGLWAAGAEAVSVNDLRVTARTAVRSAGEAVLVDFRPLSPPYVVRAVGEPRRMQVTFVDGEAARRLTTYTALYGLRFSVEAQDALQLPAGTVPEPRAAVAVPGTVPAGPS